MVLYSRRFNFFIKAIILEKYSLGICRTDSIDDALCVSPPFANFLCEALHPDLDLEALLYV